MSTTPNYGLYVTDDITERFKDWREAINGTDDSNMVKIDAALGEKADNSKSVNAVLSADGWSEKKQTVLIDGLTATQNGIISLALTATEEQREQVRGAIFYIAEQTAGALTVGADGDLPTEDIPVTIIILG